MRIRKILALAASATLFALPAVAAVQGIQGDCVDCHTMHNSELGQPVARIGINATLTTNDKPIQNLLKFDCIACHANPAAGGKIWTGPTGTSTIPQVQHSSDDNLAGGNFRYNSLSQRKGHNVIDLTPADNSNANTFEGTEAVFGAPPGNALADHHAVGVFSTTATTAFDAFTCAGARGCHGTRSQVLSGSTGDWDANASTPNTFGNAVRRTGIAAVSGAHHASFDGAKTDNGYTAESAHSGAKVAAGYRMIPGLKAYGNETDRWENKTSASHNEYFATAGNTIGAGNTTGGSCGTCHIEGNTQGGLGSRASFTSTLKVPGNDMSGFCGTCHGVFHSAGTADLNGTSGAFLRHPSDWVIPGGTTEYAGYTVYDITAPVARPSVLTAADSVVRPGTDMVMCLSCHSAHATQHDYMLRGDYSLQSAGAYANIAAAKAAGFCQACHTTKGVLPQNRN